MAAIRHKHTHEIARKQQQQRAHWRDLSQGVCSIIGSKLWSPPWLGLPARYHVSKCAVSCTQFGKLVSVMDTTPFDTGADWCDLKAAPLHRAIALHTCAVFDTQEYANFGDHEYDAMAQYLRDQDWPSDLNCDSSFTAIAIEEEKRYEKNFHFVPHYETTNQPVPYDVVAGRPVPHEWCWQARTPAEFMRWRQELALRSVSVRPSLDGALLKFVEDKLEHAHGHTDYRSYSSTDGALLSSQSHVQPYRSCWKQITESSCFDFSSCRVVSFHKVPQVEQDSLGERASLLKSAGIQEADQELVLLLMSGPALEVASQCGASIVDGEAVEMGLLDAGALKQQISYLQIDDALGRSRQAAYSEMKESEKQAIETKIEDLGQELQRMGRDTGLNFCSMQKIQWEVENLVCSLKHSHKEANTGGPRLWREEGHRNRGYAQMLVPKQLLLDSYILVPGDDPDTLMQNPDSEFLAELLSPYNKDWRALMTAEERDDLQQRQQRQLERIGSDSSSMLPGSFVWTWVGMLNMGYVSHVNPVWEIEVAGAFDGVHHAADIQVFSPSSNCSGMTMPKLWHIYTNRSPWLAFGSIRCEDQLRVLSVQTNMWLYHFDLKLATLYVDQENAIKSVDLKHLNWDSSDFAAWYKTSFGIQLDWSATEPALSWLIPRPLSSIDVNF